MSPVEVGFAIRAALDAGASMQECAAALQFRGTGHIGRFLRILKMPEELQHLVSWGAGQGGVGFSAAYEMVALKSDSDQRAVADAVLTKRLTSKEVRQVAQLRRRTGQSIESCITEALGMRTQIDRRYVFLGSMDKACSARLDGVSQEMRNQLLTAAMKQLGLHQATGRLGTEFFTLVGGDEFRKEMNRVGKDNIEHRIRSSVCEALRHDASAS